MIRVAAMFMAASFAMVEASCNDVSSDGSDTGGPLDGWADAGAPIDDGWDAGAPIDDPTAPLDPTVPLDPIEEPWVPGGPLDIVASRTSGVAPLLVVFEGDVHPGQTADAPFHDLDYAWDFGDPGSGRWGTTGASKNDEYGPIAAHVFEEPGTYTVRLAVRNADGALTTGEVAVTVQDPDVVFSGTKTVCVSGAGNFSGCPVGATQVTTSSMSQAMTHVATGKRILLHRGESFSGGGRVNVPGPGIVGAYGTGAAPRLALSGGEATGFSLSGSNPQISDWRIMDLEIDGTGASSATAVAAGGTVRDTLVLRVDAHDIATGFEFSHFVLAYYYDVAGNTNMRLHDVVGVVDSSASEFTGGSGKYGAFLSGNRFAMLGTDIDLGTRGEHVVRVSTMQASVFGHDVFSHPLSGKHCFKLHGTEWSTGSALTDRLYSERIVVRRTTFVGANNDWLVVPGPENAETDERVRDVIFDGNYFVAGPGTQVGLVIECEGVTARNNVFDMSAGFERTCATIADRGAAPSPRDVMVAHNTCYSSAGSVSLVGGAGSFPNTSVLNNLAAAAGGASVPSSATGIAAGNLATKTPGFVVSSPSSVEDFALAGSSTAIDRGAALPVPMRDIRGSSRSADAVPDVGAFEAD